MTNFKKNILFFGLLALTSCVTAVAENKSDLQTNTSQILNSESDISAESVPLKQIQKFQQRYQLITTQQKLVDNFGEGYEPLYGVRNLRAVLPGVIYRGGANNAYNKYGKRDNMNPLPDLGLKNLCQEGFKTAVYLYSTRFSTAPQSLKCVDNEKNNNQIQYRQLTALDSNNTEAFIKLVYQAIKGEIPSPIYFHCWNGWHASGLVSTLTLRQFCGYTAEQALAYWTSNTDGHSDGYSEIKNRIKNFKPLVQYTLTPEEKQIVCTLKD